MNCNLKRSITSLALIFMLFVAFIVPNATASSVTLNYLALGDSLAAGVTPQKTIDKGYADLAAMTLREKNVLGTFSKDFAVPADKTSDVLEDITVNAHLREAIKNSNTISISAGANDLLTQVDFTKNPIVIDLNLVKTTLQTIGNNYKEILEAIKELNPNANVYVMGYYYAFPYVSDDQKPQLIQLTQTLNTTIQVSAKSLGANFVPVYKQFGDDSKQFLPNPSDIHPNLEGYKIMSEALVESILNAQFEKETPIAKDIPKDFWAEKELNLLLANGLYKLDEKGHVNPGVAISRAEVADILYKSIPTIKSTPVNPGFKDVPESHPSYEAIAKLTEVGIFAKSDKFNPDDPITRVQMAKVMSLSFQLKGNGEVPNFKDINAKYWGTPYISAMSSNKIMIGYSSGTFGINDKTSRAQFAVILVRVQNKIVNN